MGSCRMSQVNSGGPPLSPAVLRGPGARISPLRPGRLHRFTVCYKLLLEELHSSFSLSLFFYLSSHPPPILPSISLPLFLRTRPLTCLCISALQHLRVIFCEGCVCFALLAMGKWCINNVILVNTHLQTHKVVP